MSLPTIAYFSMEVAIDQSIPTYAGGLGFLAGSLLRSAWEMEMPLIGISILWSQGYGQQKLTSATTAEIEYRSWSRDGLEETGLSAVIPIFDQPVRVKAYYLPPQRFGTAPVYFLSTDTPENPPAARRYTEKLYDSDERTRIGQEMVLGIGGYQILRQVGPLPDVYHLNEGHSAPLLFQLLAAAGGDLEAVRQQCVFTTHTPIAAGNETHDAQLLTQAGYFGQTTEAIAIAQGGSPFSLTAAALRMCRIANGVSLIHGKVANELWETLENRCPIIAITNSVNLHYWQDSRFRQAGASGRLLSLKRQMKASLFQRVEQETGKKLNPDVLTIVWARRFTEYKRPTLIFRDLNRLKKRLQSNQIQLIFAGRFHPNDAKGRQLFNQVLSYSQALPNIAVLLNYELTLSKQLKCGADVWLNTPLRPLEASGTSGMSASMNGAVHFSTYDGWAVEGTFHHINGYIINPEGHCETCNRISEAPVCQRDERDRQDYESLMDILETDIIPTYYQDPARWAALMAQSIHNSEIYFHSDRMMLEYFNRMYRIL
ncbi:alpha-glucan family phosphorylase [Vampirovibrio chlorellavorus]|uniref:alpha-glucan family phosphorylase n=1 Tax=Vampirovibrio chlorellavorus TaxID=758823 RepID=UPI0026E940B4|nr:alpha-glucan family phosphorylase [Vampirovibrio chlorellavorus]